MISTLPFLGACASCSTAPAPGTRYVPDRAFPPEFEVDGLRILFSGTEAEPPAGARLWGTPFRLATLRRAGP